MSNGCKDVTTLERIHAFPQELGDSDINAYLCSSTGQASASLSRSCFTNPVSHDFVVTCD